MVARHGLKSRVFFEKSQENLVGDRGIEVSAFERREPPAKVPLQNRINGAPSVLEDVIVKDHMARSCAAIAFYPRQHFEPPPMMGMNRQ
jgi:hypothetical protein